MLLSNHLYVLKKLVENAFIRSQFTMFCMLYSLGLNKQINFIHAEAIRIIYWDKWIDISASICQRNLYVAHNMLCKDVLKPGAICKFPFIKTANVIGE